MRLISSMHLIHTMIPISSAGLQFLDNLRWLTCNPGLGNRIAVLADQPPFSRTRLTCNSANASPANARGPKSSFCDYGTFICPGKGPMAYVRGLCGSAALQKWARVLPDDPPVNHLAHGRPHEYISTYRKLEIMVSSISSAIGSQPRALEKRLEYLASPWR